MIATAFGVIDIMTEEGIEVLPIVEANTSGTEVVINEFVWDCVGTEPTEEFVELYNPTGSAIDLVAGDYKVGDEETETAGEGMYYFPTGAVIPAGGHYVIAYRTDIFFTTYGKYPDAEFLANSADIPDMPKYTAWASGSISLTAGDELLLLKGAGDTLVDDVTWGTSTWDPPAASTSGMVPGNSLSRTGGADTDTDNVDFSILSVPTPTNSSGVPDLPPEITGVQSQPGNVTCLINWTTNEEATTVLRYSTSSDLSGYTEISDESFVTDHYIFLTGLTFNQQYYYQVESTDRGDLTTTDKEAGPHYTFTTYGQDLASPVISNVQSSVDGIFVDVTWTTNEEATSIVHYGTSVPPDQHVSDTAIVTSHSIRLLNIQEGAHYYFSVESRDPSGNAAVDDKTGSYYEFDAGTFPYNFYLGSFHSHTSYSSDWSGTSGLTPEDAFAFAKDDAGIDILATTDHVQDLSTTEYTNTRNFAAAYDADPDFCAIPGQEWGIWTITGHSNVWNSTTLCDVDPYSGSAIPDFYTWLASTSQTPSGYNHPEADFFNYFEYYGGAEPYVSTVEVWNGAHGYFFDFIDDVLDKGWKVGFVANQDNHKDNWGSRENNDDRVPITGVLATDLSRGSVMDAFANLRTYGYLIKNATPSTFPAINRSDEINITYMLNGHLMGDSITASNQLSFNITVDANVMTDQIIIYEDCNAIYSEGIYKADFTANINLYAKTGDHYYFVYLRQVDGDELLTTPVWVSTPPKVIPDEIPEIGSTYRDPTSPCYPEPILITSSVSDDSAISSVKMYYSTNFGGWTVVDMVDDGTGGDVSANDGIYSYQIPAQANGTTVRYYVLAMDDNYQFAFDPASGGANAYQFEVGPHLLISEVYWNPYGNTDPPPTANESAEFVEIYNPLSRSVDLSDYWIQDQVTESGRQVFGSGWRFPEGAVITAGDLVVVAKNAGDDPEDLNGFNQEGFYSSYQQEADFELYSASYSGWDYDNPSIDNMVLVSGSGLTELAQGGDAVYLRDENGTIVDGIAWGDNWILDWNAVGRSKLGSCADNQSACRDSLGTDTDDAEYDWRITGNDKDSADSPNPGFLVNWAPRIRDITLNPVVPEGGDYVNVSMTITDETSVTAASLYYYREGIETGWSYEFINIIGNKIGDTYWGEIPPASSGTTVHYWIWATDGSKSGTAPPGASANNLTYTVWPHLVISEVFWNTPGDIGYTNNASFVEIYNPADTSVSLQDYILEDYRWKYSHEWYFPSGASIAARDTIVVAKDAGGTGDDANGRPYSGDEFYSYFGFTPDYEMYDADISSYSRVDSDNGAVTNMVNELPADTYDQQILLYYNDGLYLADAGRTILDAVQYGGDSGMYGESISTDLYAPAGFASQVGNYATADCALGQSLHRNVAEKDTNDCDVDFYLLPVPSPGQVSYFKTVSTNNMAFSIPWAEDYVNGTSLGTSVFSSVAAYESGVWKFNVTGKDWSLYGTAGKELYLSSLGNSRGYLARSTAPDVLYASGSIPTTTDITISMGWNLIGMPLIKDRVIDSFFDANPTAIQRVEYMDDAGTWVAFSDHSSEKMMPGYAYWVYSNVGFTQTVDYA